MEDWATIQELMTPLGISLGVGLLVGLQREHAGTKIAGVRTFPLIAVLGTLSGMVGGELGGLVVAAGLLAVVIAMTAANLMILRQEGERGSGLTTEISILLMYVLGVYAAFGEPWVVLAVGAAVAILLFLKSGLHAAVDKIGDKDMRAIMLFAAITFVVLPVLPDQTYGPYDAWNPRMIWLVVVLVVGISLGGYIAYKVWGGRGGTLAAGVLGGVISSTATTVSYARRAGVSREMREPALLVIAIATCMSYARVLVEIGVVAPGLLRQAAVPIVLMASVAVAGVVIGWFVVHRNGNTLPEQENPTQLKSALVFAGIFALVLVGVEAARRNLGEEGLFAASAVAGLVNLDAITLTNSRIAANNPDQAALAWRAIMVALVANLAFKAGVTAALGNRALFLRVLAVFVPQAAAGVAIVLFWPGS